ncbi:MAG: RND family transporter [Candidatus Tectimicrobiota bacterium]
MKTFARGLIRWQWAVLLLLIGSTSVALYGITLLRIDPSNTRLLPRQGEDADRYRDFLATFGSDEDLLVALHDPQHSLLGPEGLTAIRHLTQDLEALTQVAAVRSLSNVPDMAQVRLTPFGLALPRLLPETALTPERQEALRHNEQILGTLLSADTHTAGILVVPQATESAAQSREPWLAAVRAVAAQHARDGRQTYVAGTPLERSDVTAYIRRDQQRIVPLVLLILLSVTYSIYRVRRLALLSLACVLVSLTWTMGLVGFLGLPLNVITSLLPAVILVVSVSVSIHLVNQFIDELAAGAVGQHAVEQAVAHVGTACLLTSLTNAMGFFSLPVIQAPAIQEFGLFAGLGVLLAFVATMLLAPLVLLRLDRVTPARLRHLKEGRLETCLDRLTHWVAQHRRRVGYGIGALIALMLPGVWQIRVGTDIVRALKHDAPLRVSSEFIDQHLTGVHSLEFLVQASGPADARAPATIRRLLAFSTWLGAQPGVTAVFSPWEPLRSVPQTLLADDEQLTVLATLLPLGFPLTAWLDASGQRLRLSARVLSLDSARFLDLAQQSQAQASAMGLTAQVTGTNYLLANMSHILVQNQITSLLCAAAMILGTITLALRSWKMGLAAALPNVLPTLMIFGLMGWLGIELSTATAMIASVALGLFVDDTIHLLYLYMQHKQAGDAPLTALTSAVHHAGRAVLFTSLILTLGFWAGLCGSFKPTLYFSFLMGLTMLFAVVTELLVTPAAVLTIERVTAPATRSA